MLRRPESSSPGYPGQAATSPPRSAPRGPESSRQPQKQALPVPARARSGSSWADPWRCAAASWLLMDGEGHQAPRADSNRQAASLASRIPSFSTFITARVLHMCTGGNANWLAQVKGKDCGASKRNPHHSLLMPAWRRSVADKSPTVIHNPPSCDCKPPFVSTNSPMANTVSWLPT